VRITSVQLQAKNKNRVNVHVDGAYRFSLDVFQLGELGIKVGRDYSEEELQAVERESLFGKLYSRALEWALGRPHSERETRDYLYRTSRPKRRKNGELTDAIPTDIGERVLQRLREKGYVDDGRFARFWVENRKLSAELSAKGIDRETIEVTFGASERAETDELRKVIAKKASHYTDAQKLIAYLARQGFSYDDIKHALSENNDPDA
jgi:regulatory protein